MTKKEMYEIMDRLGMIEDNDNKLCNGDEDEPFKSEAELFDEFTSKDLVSTMNFVEELCLYNDLDTIKKFLITLFYTNKE